jgi:ribosomal protein L37AE/L43A
MVDEMTETTKISSTKCPKCGNAVEETRNAVAFIEACTKCDWRNAGLFL